jgi:hypothetical protein
MSSVPALAILAIMLPIMASVQVAETAPPDAAMTHCVHPAGGLAASSPYDPRDGREGKRWTHCSC